MSTTGEVRVRRSLTELQDAYERGDKGPLETLMRAWRHIKSLDGTDRDSFFRLGGYHGEPFRGAGWGSSAWWGGYCHHGNVLFPIWHRVYLFELEEALRRAPGCADVTLPFWDECVQDGEDPIPWALTVETFELDGETIPNPLRSYTFPLSIVDHISTDDPVYTKPRGYETVRYPYSGLVGSADDRERTAKHNAQWTYPESVAVLNANVRQWLEQTVVIGHRTVTTGVRQLYVDCLAAPSYTVFSNTSSAAEHNDDAAVLAVPLESPHNKIHLAVGGFDTTAEDDSVIPGANGDMGENDTAGLDPIFYFHHCFIDHVFWLWQRRHGQTDDLPVQAGYPGTNSVDGQNPTPGIPGNAWLSMDTPLEPFERPDGSGSYTGRDAFDIESQLGYTYGPSSLDAYAAPASDDAEPERHVAAAAPADEPRLRVHGVQRGAIRGSFVIDAYATVDGVRTLIGSEAVLSRWHVEGCANCLTHLRSGGVFSLRGLHAAGLSEDGLEVEVRTRDGLLGGGPRRLGAPAAAAEHEHFRVEVR